MSSQVNPAAKVVKTPIEAMNRLSQQEFQKTSKFPWVILLDNVRSMMNTGSVFRTADAFLIEKIILCGITASPPHREIHKTALGATETVAWEYEENPVRAIERLRKAGYCIVAIEQTSESIDLAAFRPEPEKPYCLVFGNEVRGVSEEVLPLCDSYIEIPQFGSKHSLNVAVTAGMVVWDFYSKTRL